jgi:NNP family nitrate/nitrite transporter-like MFS transporter
MSMDPSPRSAEAPAQATTVEAPHRGERDQANTMLVLATVGFMVNFWAWALISPLGAAYRDDLGLSAFEQALVVAVPVLVGSLGRIPVGAFTDKLGARVMFPAVSFATVVPVLFLAAFDDSLAALLIGGFFLGIGGTAFAVGIPFVNAWFPPARRGLALGLFGVGMGGTAISAFTTVRLADEFGRATPFVIVACALTAYGIVAMLLLRDAPGRVPPTGGFWSRTMATLRMRATLQLAWLYAVGFGGFVAFSVYLPTYLKNAYDLTPSDAANRTAGFVILAVAMRPVGGWLSDRIHPVPVLTTCFVAATGLATLAAFELTLIPWATIAFLGLAAVLGAASGAVFALVALLAPLEKVGSVTGVVGAAGGLGGFIPPLVMGVIYGQSDDYSLGYVLLALVALGSAAFTATVVRRETR